MAKPPSLSWLCLRCKWPKTDQDERTQHLTHSDPQPLNLEVLHERLADRVGRIINEIGLLCHIPRLKLMTGGTERPNLSTADPFRTTALSSLPSSPATLATTTASEWVVSKLRACKCCYWTVLIHALHALCTRAECGASVRWHSVIATVYIRLTGLRYSYGDLAKVMLLRLPVYTS
jgi:hypothetical protein